jgi:hypothetical protein
MKLNNSIAISDTGFVFNPVSGESFTLNPIGLDVVKLIKKDHTKEEIIQFLLTKYESDRQTIEKDFFEFLNILSIYQILETTDTLNFTEI